MCLSTHTPGLNPSLTSGRLNQLLLSQINLVILYQVQSKCSEIEIASNLAKRKLSMCLCLRQNYDPNAWSEGQDFLHITIHHISSIPFLHCSLFPHIYNVFYLLWGQDGFSFQSSKGRDSNLHALHFQRSSLWRSELFHKSYFTLRSCPACMCRRCHRNPHTNITTNTVTHAHTQTNRLLHWTIVLIFVNWAKRGFFLFAPLWHFSPPP